MAAWRSDPGGDRRLGGGAWLLASVTAWLGPALPGLALLAMAFGASRLWGLSGGAEAAHPLAAVYVAGFVLVFSPVLSWVGVLVALVPAWMLLRRGWGGWASFGALGLVAGMLAGTMVQGFLPGLAAAHGVVAALLFRWVFCLIEPDIFTAR